MRLSRKSPTTYPLQEHLIAELARLGRPVEWLAREASLSLQKVVAIINGQSVGLREAERLGEALGVGGALLLNLQHEHEKSLAKK